MAISHGTIKQTPYRVSPVVKKEIDRQEDEMLEKGIIQESVSPWSSPVVLVKKKDGSYRFCVDFRKVNKVTKVDSFPMPLVADALDSLAGASVFSTLISKVIFGKYKCRRIRNRRQPLLRTMAFTNF